MIQCMNENKQKISNQFSNDHFALYISAAKTATQYTSDHERSTFQTNSGKMWSSGPNVYMNGIIIHDNGHH